MKNQNSTHHQKSSKKERPMFKLNKLFNITLFALLATVLVISCDGVTSGDVKEPAEKEITVEQMSNPDNPYDEEGAIHNKFLDYFVKATAEDSAISRDQIAVVIRNFYEENGMKYGDEQMRAQSQVFEVYTQLGIGNPQTVFPRPIDGFCEQFPIICDILNPTGPFIPYLLQNGDLDDENGGTSTDRTLKFIETTKEQEAKVLADRELSDEHRNGLLVQYAVARYSAGYWHNVKSIQQEESGYYNDFAEAELAADCHVCDVVGSDAGGAGVGALIGGPVGGGIGAGVASAASVIEKIFW